MTVITECKYNLLRLFLRVDLTSYLLDRYDLRQGSEPILRGEVSEEPLNCATFNNVNESMFACGGEDNSVSIWDMRMPDNYLNDMRFHEQQVTSLEWHPKAEQMLLSGASDGKVYLWDNSKNGEE